MDFYLQLKKGERPASLAVVQQQEEEPAGYRAGNVLFFLGEGGHTTLEAISVPQGQAWIMGDPVYHAEDKKGIHAFLERNEFGNFFRAVDGFYFLLHWDRAAGRLTAGSSMFSILPVFYAETRDLFLVSSSFDLLRNTGKIPLTPDRQYYLEKALFNYPLFTRAPLEAARTVPSNHLLAYNGTLSLSRHTNIADYFVSSPIPWRKALNHLSDVFIEKAGAFIPRERFCATLTGGFDGRAAVSLALALKRPFYTYSYGTEGDPDVQAPLMISRELGFAHRPLLLGPEYSARDFWKCGLAFLSQSYGLGNMSRAHYYHALQTVLKDSRYLLSGNFGSELIRSMKAPGVMTSTLLFELFEKPGRERLSGLIRRSPASRYLATSLVEECTEPLLEEISSYLGQMPRHLSANKRFYTFLFEEAFPKYFGPEITVQRRFLNHRAPFLCFGFLEELLKTGVAGANSNFRETNPFRRYHGQALYAYILKRTAPRLLDLPLDRGYKPRDFLTPAGPARIAAGYAWGKLWSNKDIDIPDYARDNIARNLKHIRTIPLSPEIFNIRHFEHQLEGKWVEDQMNFANMISAARYQSLLERPHRNIAQPA